MISGEKVKDITAGLSHLDSDEVKEIKQKFELSQKQIVVDMLNIIFGKSELSSDF